jgi:hypothetical protein
LWCAGNTDSCSHIEANGEAWRSRGEYHSAETSLKAALEILVAEFSDSSIEAANASLALSWPKQLDRMSPERNIQHDSTRCSRANDQCFHESSTRSFHRYAEHV